MEAELEKLEYNLGGVRDMKRLPQAALIIDLKTEAIAVAEATRLGIPILGLVDSNVDPIGGRLPDPRQRRLDALVRDGDRRRSARRSRTPPPPTARREAKRRAEEEASAAPRRRRSASARRRSAPARRPRRPPPRRPPKRPPRSSSPQRSSPPRPPARRRRRRSPSRPSSSRPAPQQADRPGGRGRRADGGRREGREGASRAHRRRDDGLQGGARGGRRRPRQGDRDPPGQGPGVGREALRAGRPARASSPPTSTPAASSGVLVEVQCETDFVARNDDFQEFAREVAIHIAAAAPLYVSADEIPEDEREAERRVFEEKAARRASPRTWSRRSSRASSPSGRRTSSCSSRSTCAPTATTGKTIEQIRADLAAKTGENIRIARFARFAVGEE